VAPKSPLPRKGPPTAPTSATHHDGAERGAPWPGWAADDPRPSAEAVEWPPAGHRDRASEVPRGRRRECGPLQATEVCTPWSQSAR
jgi:hypothetical protein